MIDFGGLVLAPAMAVFARPVTVTPLVSQPGAAAYPARGVWAVRAIDVPLEDGTIMNSKVLTLGIRTAEFAVRPRKGDQIEVLAHGSLPRVGICLVDDTNPDGQGGMSLIAKVIGP